MTQIYAQVLDSVQIVRRSWQIRRAMEGLVLALAVGLGVLTLAAMIDHAFALNIPGRLLLSLILWLSVVGVVLRWVARPLATHHSDDFFAALIEQRHPGLGNRLINALQLGREERPLSPRLVEAIVADGAMAVDNVRPGQAVSSLAMRNFALALLAALAVMGLYVLAARQAATTAAWRVLLPAADIMPFTWTHLDVAPAQPLTLLEGSELRVEATTSGRAPATEATLVWADARGNRHRLAMSRIGQEQDANRFAHVFSSVEADFEYFVTAGDARSRPVAVTVDPRPRVIEMNVTYNYPAYTGLPARKMDKFDGHIHGLPQTRASLSVKSNKPLDKLVLVLDNNQAMAMQSAGDATWWTGDLTLDTNGVYFYKLDDGRNGEMEDAARYTITLEQDMPPVVGFAKPGRDIQLRPDNKVEFVLAAQDDLGVGLVQLLGRINPDRQSGKPADEGTLIHQWPHDEPQPQRRVDLPALEKALDDLGLKAGDRLEYWAVALDRNNIATQPGRGESRHYSLIVLTPEQAQARMDQQLAEYARLLTELIRLQQLNRTQTAGYQPALPLIDRQSVIRRGTMQLAELMQKNLFPGLSIMEELSSLAADPMAKVITHLESFRDAPSLEAGKAAAADSLPIQNDIIAALEELLKRVNRDQTVRDQLKRIEKTDQAQHKEMTALLGKLGKDLDQFLTEQREIKDQYEKLSKKNDDEVRGEDLQALSDAEHRLDRWKQWAKDSVDAITKLPDGFVKDSALAENISTIFEEIEKKQRGATTEIATPIEEGVMAVGTTVKEDLEIWMPDSGDAAKWVMEDPLGGNFDVPPYTLPDNLQDMVGDLIEDLEEFDEEADDVTGGWGGNIDVVGWDIMDGPISSFAAQGKTGNQLPNNSEISGRSGAGRRGKSSGQMVGDESTAMEGRPTPARLTNERYEEGQPKADKQLDPRGATGGGKKTGGGVRGLQGGSPPDFVKDMERMKEYQKQLREQMQQIAKQLEGVGRPSSHVNRAMQLLEGADQDMNDQRYEDSARKRKTALSELKAEQSQIDQVVSLSLQKAPNLPPEMRQQITAGAQQQLPEGFEDLVGAYYKALSGASSGNNPGRSDTTGGDSR